MRFNTTKRAREASFDLTPMIDVVFLLIIFFSMTSQFSETQLTPVDLPRERGDRKEQVGTMSIMIDMDKDGRFTVMGKEYGPADLSELLTRQANASSGSTKPLEVIVRADRTCMTVHLDGLARMLADAGILQWKLATTGAQSNAE